MKETNTVRFLSNPYELSHDKYHIHIGYEVDESRDINLFIESLKPMELFSKPKSLLQRILAFLGVKPSKNPRYVIGDEVICDSGFEYEIGTFKGFNKFNEVYIEMLSGKHKGANLLLPLNEIIPYTFKQAQKLTEKYGYVNIKQF
jgi:hypothetical protein